MLSSGQVSQMFAQQNQQFAGNSMYSQQISQQMPGMYPGGYGGGFSYGGGSHMGNDFTSRTSGGVMSAIGGAAQFAMGAGAVMGGLGMGGPLRMLDPFAGAGAMYRAGGAMGMGMGGRLAMGAVGMLPAAGIMAAGSHVIGSMMSGAQQQAGIENVLGRNFNFSNPSSGGRGFSRQQGMVIGDMVRQMENMPEMMTSMGELTRIMDKMGQMGSMNGITNVRDFGSKFKSTIQTLREISKVIGSTMEEALQVMQESKMAGFHSKGDIARNVMNRQLTGGLTGMNQGQVGQIQSYGAQMGFATGGSRATGANHALRMAKQLGMANQMGILSSDQIMELTGQEGAEGIQALTGQLTQAGYRMSGGALGTAMSIAMAEQSNGKFTGKMDSGLMERFRRGDISKGEMLRMVHQKTASRGSKMSYVANKGRLRSEMAGEMGVEGQMSMLGMVLGERGYDNPDALNIVSQGFGLDEREAGLMVELGKKMPDIGLEMKSRGRAEAKRIAQQSFMKENFSWDAVKTKVGKKIEGVVSEPFKKFGAELRNSINNAVDDFVDDITGRYKVEVTSGMSKLMQGAGSGLSDSRNQLAGMLSGSVGKMIGGNMGRGVNMAPGALGSAMNWMTGNQSAGERAANAMALTTVGMNSLQRVTTQDEVDVMQKGGYNVLDNSSRLFNTSVRMMATDDQMQAAGARLQGLVSGRIGAGDAILGNISKSSDFGSARGDIVSQELWGRRLGGGGLGRMGGTYGVADITAAAAQGGSGSALARQALERYGSDADLLTMSPDRQKAMSDRIKGFERGSAQAIFGNAGADEFMSAYKGFQGSKAGDFLEKTFLRSFGAQEQSAAQGMAGTAAQLLGHGNEGLGREMGAKLMGITAGVLGYGDDTTHDLQSIARGRGDDSRDDYFKSLAMKEMYGDGLTAGEKVETGKFGEAYESIKDEVRLREVSAKGSQPNAAWTDDEKKFLKKMGYDEKSFTPDVAKKMGKIGELMGRAKLDPKAREELGNYMKDLKAQGITEIAQRYQEKGKSVAAGVAALRGSGFKLGKEEEAALKRIEAYAGRMSGMKTLGDIQSAYGIDPTTGKVKAGATSITEDVGALAYDLAGMKDQKAVSALVSTDEDLSAAVGRAQHVKRRLGRNKTYDSFFDKEAFSRMDAAGQAQMTQVRSQYFDEKGRVKDEAAFTKYMAGQEGQKLMTAAGAEQRSQYASQADIAKNMESFGASVASLATIVQSMKDGKPAEGKK